MKTLISTTAKTKLFIAAFAVTSLFSCSKDDSTPAAVNEEELITTITAIFTPDGGGTAVSLLYKDLDGDGPSKPTIIKSGNFAKNTTYNGVVSFKNEAVNPAQDISAEILEEGLKHQIFYQKTGTLNNISYRPITNGAASNYDSKGNPIGFNSVFTTTGAASGDLIITLRHEPNKSAANVSNGDITNAGGSTDAEAKFTVSVL